MAATTTPTPDAANALQALLAFRIVDRCGDPRSSAVEIADLVAADAELSRLVLQTARSPLYGITDPDITVQRAVVLLGLDAIRSIAVVGLARQLGDAGDAAGTDRVEFWHHAALTAAAAEVLARVADVGPNEAFMAGLLHDVGAPPDGAWADDPGDDHGLTARALLGTAVPESVLAAIENHHTNPEGQPMMTRVLIAADHLAHVLRAAEPGLPPSRDLQAALDELGLGWMGSVRHGPDIRRLADLKLGELL